MINQLTYLFWSIHVVLKDGKQLKGRDNLNRALFKDAKDKGWLIKDLEYVEIIQENVDRIQKPESVSTEEVGST